MNIYIVRKPVGIMLLAALFAPVCRLEAKTLDYLPRNESIEISSTSKAVIKGELPCNPSGECKGAGDVIRAAQECQDCMDLKITCPDCCLTTGPAPKSGVFESTRCAIGGDPAFMGATCKTADDAAYKFDEGSCPDWSFYYTNLQWAIFGSCRSTLTSATATQKIGCPSLTAVSKDDPPDPDLPDAPRSKHNEPSIKGCDDYLHNFPGHDYFDHGSTPTATAAYQAFVTACKVDANNREMCANSINCCKQNVTCGIASTTSKPSNYDTNCSDSACNKRVEGWEKPDKTVTTWDGKIKECHALSTQDCVNLKIRAANYLSVCDDCFQPIYAGDNDFYYKFVAKSKESVVILWKLYAVSASAASPTTYFYSKIRVEDATGHTITQSPVHQKGFAGSFNIFSALSVPGDSLKQGEVYYVRPYYFVAKDPTVLPYPPGLQMRVEGAELMAVKVRQ